MQPVARWVIYICNIFKWSTNKPKSINKLIHISVVLFCSAIFYPLSAQVKFYALVSERAIVPGQAFQVQYIAEGATDIQQFTIPPFNDFLVIDSFESKSTSFQSPGLKMIDVYSRIVVLLARKEGRFTLPAASAIIDGKKRKTNVLKMDVVVRRSVPLIINESPEEEVAVDETSKLRAGENISEKIKKNLFLKIIVNKKTCYTGEALLLNYKMYSRIDASSQVLKRPSLTGLSIVEMADTYDGKPEIEKINGVAYYVNLIRKVQGFPLQSGLISLDKAEVASIVHFLKIEEPGELAASGQRTTFSLYDYPVTLTTPPQSVEVKPLPATNQPQNFSGAVGKFSMRMQIENKDIHPGELVKIRLVINGTGNIPLLIPPVVQWPKGVDTTEPEVKEDFNKYVYPLEGSKSFEYSFTAPDTGVYIIPAAKFDFFNPVTNSYQYSRSDSVKLVVTPDIHKSAGLVQQSIIDSSYDATPRQLYWFAGIAFLILCWIVYQIWKGKKEPDQKIAEKDQPVVIQKELMPADKLAAARAALKQSDIPAYYHELEKAVWIVIRESFNIMPSQLNKQNASAVLLQKGVSPELTMQLMEILNKCEWALYAPAQENVDAENLLVKTVEIIEKLSSV